MLFNAVVINEFYYNIMQSVDCRCNASFLEVSPLRPLALPDCESFQMRKIGKLYN